MGMNQIKVGHFESDGGAVHIPIGFVPDWILFIAMGESDGNATFIHWFREMGSHGADGTLYDGVQVIDGGDNRITAAAGIKVYDTAAEIPTVTRWSGTASPTVKTATTHGSYYKATTSGVDVNGNAIDESAIFEMVAGATTGSTEPVWPTVVGERGPLDGDVLWERVNISLKRGGYKGFTIAAFGNLADTDEGYFIAIQADGVEDYGDVASWVGGVRGA